MAKITTRAAGLGACAVLLGGLGAGVPAVAGATARAAAGAAVASRRAAEVARPARAGWRRYRVPVKGQANLIAAAAPGRDDAWASGFTIHNSVVAPAPRRLAGRRAAAEPPDHLRPARGGPDPGRDRSGAGGGRRHPVPAHRVPGQRSAALERTRLDRVHAPDVTRINYLSAAGPSSAWASGDCGLLGWNGRSWRLVSFPMPAASLQPGAGRRGRGEPGRRLAARLDLRHADVRRRELRGPLERPPMAAGHAASGAAPGQRRHPDRDRRPWSPRRVDRRGCPRRRTVKPAHEGHPAALGRPVLAAPAPARQRPRIRELRRWRADPAPPATSGPWAGTSSGPTRTSRASRSCCTGMAAAGPPPGCPPGAASCTPPLGPGGRLLAVGDTFSPDQTSYGLDILRWTGRAWVHAPCPRPGRGAWAGSRLFPAAASG